MKITKRQLKRIIKEELNDIARKRIVTGDPIGAQEAYDIAEFLEQTRGLVFSRGGMQRLIDFLVAEEDAGNIRRTR